MKSGGQPLDLSTAVGRMLMTILAAFGEMERNHHQRANPYGFTASQDTGKRFTYDKYGWDVDEDNNFVSRMKKSNIGLNT